MITAYLGTSHSPFPAHRGRVRATRANRQEQAGPSPRLRWPSAGRRARGGRRQLRYVPSRGYPAEELIKASRDADLLVVGSPWCRWISKAAGDLWLTAREQRPCRWRLVACDA